MEKFRGWSDSWFNLWEISKGVRFESNKHVVVENTSTSKYYKTVNIKYKIIPHPLDYSNYKHAAHETKTKNHSKHSTSLLP